MWRLIRLLADAALAARAEELETLLRQERSRNRVLQAEVETLAAVAARDRARVHAETAKYARRAEGGSRGR
jgi:hypothetical protein